jgi:hypothetical protein
MPPLKIITEFIDPLDGSGGEQAVKIATPFPVVRAGRVHRPAVDIFQKFLHLLYMVTTDVAGRDQPEPQQQE